MGEIIEEYNPMLRLFCLVANTETDRAQLIFQLKLETIPFVL